MLVWLGRVLLSAAILGLFATAAVNAQNVGNLGNGAANGAGGGFRALSGAEAAFFALPDDMNLVTSTRLGPYGLTYERYQQVFGGAKVLGGQLTLYRDDSGAVTTVIGAHYPNITPTNSVRLTPAAARGIVDRDLGPEGRRITELMIDPQGGRYFFRVETRRPNSRWILWIGAQGGQVINKYNALAYQTCELGSTQCGIGVEGDVKDLSGLSTEHPEEDPPVFWLESSDGRLGTYDQGSFNCELFGCTADISTDDDDAWIKPGYKSPGQAALVDAQYYSHVTDRYFTEIHGFNWVERGIAAGMPYPFIAIMAHYQSNYNNAFWNGSYVALGDGDQVMFRELTSLDVIVHELTHGVTEFTSDLIPQNESGALSEAFSDIMAASAEFYADANGLEPGAADADLTVDAPLFQPDWLMGEEFDLRPDTVPGFRNMGDPEEDGDPDHYSERYTGTGDDGGIHTNSGIPNHAYYLLVNGGLNAGCDGLPDLDPIHGHCTDGDGDDGLSVAKIDIADAERIFFLGFIALNSTATMCDARLATEAAAVSLAPIEPGFTNAVLADSTNDAWTAVGLTDLECGLISDPGAPARPTLLSATPDGSGNVALVWADNSTDELGFRVFRNDSPIGTGTEVANSTSYTDTNVTVGTYGYYVQAYNDAGTADSNTITVQIGNMGYVSSESTTFGTVTTGSYASTVDPNDAETLTETQTNGRNKTSRLEHIWRIDDVNIGGYPKVRLVIAAEAASNSDGDNFEFSYSTGGSYSPPLVLVQGTGQTFIVALPDGTDGTVYVKVRDSNRAKGKTSRDSVSVSQIYVEWGDGMGSVPIAPTASFTHDCMIIEQELDCNFTDTSTDDGSVVSWFWDFDDGGSSTVQHPAHTYTAPGTYTVTLTVTDDSEDSDSATAEITLEAAGGGGSMHVHELTDSSSLHKNRRKWTADVEILIHDSDSNPVSDALVDGSWSAGATGASSCATDGQGLCSVRKGGLSIDTTSVTFTVGNVTGTLTYDADGDADGHGVTSVTIQEPVSNTMWSGPPR